jgi:hypothetical protein
VKAVALRTALIWHDEVMSDIVLEKPSRITLGASGKATFVVPEIGLPPEFSIVQPGNRGYLLTLGEHMRGTICIDGEEKSVEDFVQRGGEGGSPAGGFRATAISGKDWGVIDLDASGEYKLFFQFVPVEDAQPFFTKPVIYAGTGGYLISMFTLTFLLWTKGIRVDFTLFGSEMLGEFAEALFRGWLITTAAMTVSALMWWTIRQPGDSQASLAFSVILHGAILFMTYELYDGENPFVFPGPRALTGQYLVTRLDETPPPEPPKPPPTAGVTKKEEAPAPKTPDKPNNNATKGDEGGAGGKGDHERARDPNAKDVPPAPPAVAFFADKNKKYLDNILDHSFQTQLGKFTGIKGDTLTAGSIGFGPDHGSGVGACAPGSPCTGTKGHSNKTGSGANGYSDNDIVTSKGPIDTGKNRPGGGNCVGPNCTGTGPKEVKVGMSDPSGDFGGLTAEEIDRVVKARAGVFRACYQKELNHTPGIGGMVQSTATAGGTSLHNDAVESCVKANVSHLKFPAKGGVANVTYPFVFSQGG